MFDELKKITKNYSKGGKQHSNKIKNMNKNTETTNGTKL